MLQYSFILSLFILLNCSGANNQSNTANENESIPPNNVSQPTIPEVYENIPSWYLANRVQVHTRLFLRDLSKPYFWDFPKTVAAVGGYVLTRQIKASDEQPWWKSKVGTINPAVIQFYGAGKNLALDIIKQQHDLNQKSIIYYRHMEDSEMAVLHPDWICKDVNGKILESQRGKYLCFNSPYKEVLVTRLEELASFGADGFYFDEVHIPQEGCFCEYCIKAYKQKYGRDLVSDYRNKNWISFFEFKNETLYNLFTDIEKRTGTIGNHPILLVSSSSWPGFTSLHMNSKIFYKFISKSELSVPSRIAYRGEIKVPLKILDSLSGFYWNAFIFSRERDNSLAPPHIWCPFIETKEEAEKIAAGMISLGCIANVDIEPADNIETFSSVLKWNDLYGSVFESLTPYYYDGILLSEKERNQYISEPANAWKKVINPAYVTFSRLYDMGIPVRIVYDEVLNDETLGSLNKLYCNTSYASQKNLSDKNKLTDFNEAKLTISESNAMSTGSLVFCLKNNVYTNINYFKDAKGSFYCIYSPDFVPSIHVKENMRKANIEYTKTNAASANAGFNLYVKKDFIKGTSAENLVAHSQLSSTEKNGYLIFTIKSLPPESLGILKFTLN